MVGQSVGKYRVLDRVGRGGMGTVFRAIDETLRREVAIKVLNAELNDPEVARRFRAEAVTVARLNHPGIATIYELFQHDGQWMMVMEFVRGETLERTVERLGPLSAQRAADLMMQALAALAHAHRMGVVHRDLKPANLMITESGAVKIMDFGIARVAGSEHLTHAGFLMGTPAYMAPEQVVGQEIDARTDLYSMGVVFYHLVTGKLPFKGETPIAMAQSRVSSEPTPVREARDDLPGWIAPLLDRALAKAPADRFQSADQFKEAVRRGLAGLPLQPFPDAEIPPELVATVLPGTLPAMASPPTPAPKPATMETASRAPTPLTTATNGPTGAISPTPTRPPASAPTTTAIKTAPAPPSRTALGLGAVAVVLAILIGWTWYRSHQASVASSASAAGTPGPPAPTPATETPAATASPAAAPATSPDAGSAASVPPPATLAPVTTPTPTPTTSPGAASPRAGAPATSPTASPTPPSAAGSPTPSPATSGRPTATPSPSRGSAAADLEHVAFSDAKILHIHGQKADDEDVVVNFVAGQISVTSKKGGPAIASEPYKRLVHATYVHAKNPKWDPGLPGPPADLDVSGFLRGARHWLVLQSKTDYVVLRLDDSNWRQILDTFEIRTGLKIDRPPSSDK